MTVSELRLLIRESISELMEGPRDPAIFKAVFLAGGPGSGKSFITQKLGLTAMGFKRDDPDVMFQYLMRKGALPMTPSVIGSKQGQFIRRAASDLTDKRTETCFLENRLGVVYDGTGKNYDKILKLKTEIEKIGYETCMIMVNADIDTSIGRNAQRSRQIPEDMVRRFWTDVQKNLGRFQSLFGENFYIIDNNSTISPDDLDREITRVHTKIRSWANTPPKSPIAKQWMANHP